MKAASLNCCGPRAAIGLTKREKYLGTKQWSILTQHNPCRYCKKSHMTPQRKGYDKYLSEEVFRLQIKIKKNTNVNCK